MAFGSFSGARSSTPMAEINVIPLVDIMLVLLVIFIITAPLLTHAVKIDLPQLSSAPDPARVERIELAIDADGGTYWNGERLERAALRAHLQAAGAQAPVPELQLRADRATRYETLAELMAEAGRSGLSKIAFVSVPEPAR